MNGNDDKAVIEQIRQAIAAYAGPVTRCPCGKPRAPAEKPMVRNASVEWLKQNRDAQPIRDKKAERRKKRIAHAQQQRITKRNAALFKRVNCKRGDQRRLGDREFS
jgi:hypothetical protein